MVVALAAIDADKAFPGSRTVSGSLSPKAKGRGAAALDTKALVMTGGPGVGKTTIVKAILRILAAKD